MAPSCSKTSSPKLCLLLKTLLFLLCIYLKRVTAAPTTRTLIITTKTPTTTLKVLPTTTSEKTAQETTTFSTTPASNLILDPQGEFETETIHLDQTYAEAGASPQSIQCRLDNVVRLRKAYKNAPNDLKSSLKQLRKQIYEKVKVTWLKDGLPLHRENGNFVFPSITPDSNDLELYGVGISDGGLYECLLNYTDVPREAPKYFQLFPRLAFDLVIMDHVLPDKKPTISHPPADFIVKRGSDVRFTCNREETMLTQLTYWFKSCSMSNRTCVQSFLTDFNKTQTEGQRGYMDKYLIGDHRLDTYDLFNVSEKDVAYYGCLVQNDKGMDVRKGSLNLIESIQAQEAPTLNVAPSVVPSTLPNIMLNKSQRLEDRHSLDPSKSVALNNITPPASGPAMFTGTTMASSHDHAGMPWVALIVASCAFLGIVAIAGLYFCLRMSYQREKKLNQGNLIMPEPIVGTKCQDADVRQHLPNGGCPDIYNIGKTADGFISGHLHQSNGHLMSQSICSQVLNKGKNPSISSNNSNSDEASSWGKSMSSQGDNSRAFYLHTSNTTTTTVPMYDHPPSMGTAQLCGAMLVQDACVINPTYGFLRPNTDATNWAFPRRNLERLNKIGEGQFGEVWRYIARQKDGNESFVAVKQLRNRAGLGDRERFELIAEIEIMKLVNDHPNVIKLLNYCVDDYEPILLIMEFAEHGKLQTYLRNYRSFRKSVGFIVEPNNPTITSKELIKFSYHIAKGMEYVASKGIVHRDLASRNILVSKDKVCKVADFGFARRVGDECAYERTTTNPVPVKWMAPEALVENKFTTKSDVFSLGILMWEIVTLGATPYESLSSADVYKKITSGGRLEKPAHCKDEFYNIMAKCWLHDPTQRPSFKEVAGQLEKLLLSENDYIELDQYPEHAYYNILNTEEKEIVHNGSKQ